MKYTLSHSVNVIESYQNVNKVLSFVTKNRMATILFSELGLFKLPEFLLGVFNRTSLVKTNPDPTVIIP